MISLLRIGTNIRIGNLYPVRTDTSIGAMLSRIIYIINELTEDFEGTLSDIQFEKYWNETGQVNY